MSHLSRTSNGPQDDEMRTCEQRPSFYVLDTYALPGLLFPLYLTLS